MSAFWRAGKTKLRWRESDRDVNRQKESRKTTGEVAIFGVNAGLYS